MSSVDVLTIGAATQDLFLQSDQFQTIQDRFAPDGFDACVPLGSKISLDELAITTGGGATNAAVTFSRFGLKTACVARVGKDAARNDIIATLRQAHVQITDIQVDQRLKTAHSVILVAGSGHRAILTYRGASSKIDTQRIAWKRLAPTWVYLTSLGGDLDRVRDIFLNAKRASSCIAWNPGVLELEHGLRKLTPFFKQTDILILNREEAALLTQKPLRDLRGIFKTLTNAARVALIVTDGQHGAYVHADHVTMYATALKGKRVNTTGAGDAFGSAFVASLARHRSLPQALQAGMLNAMSVVTHMGPKTGILARLPAPKYLRAVKLRVMPRL